MTTQPADLTSSPAVPVARFSARRLTAMLMPALAGVGAAMALGVCVWAFAETRFDVTLRYVVPLLGVLALVLEVFFLDIYRQHRRWEWGVAALGVVAYVGVVILPRLPEYVTGWQIHAIMHRSLFSAAILLAVGFPTLCLAIYYLGGATPRAEDLARYPLILGPVVVVLALYAYLIWCLVQQGQAGLTLEAVQTPFGQLTEVYRTFIANTKHPWPIWRWNAVDSYGLRNQLLGTGLLMALTTLVSLPLGVGTGVYLSEYGDDRWGSVIRFTITMLRGISTLALALALLSLVTASDTTSLQSFARGTFVDSWQQTQVSRGSSFLLASLVIALLVIPVMTRATEEGCRALPPELREGSLALGATEETTLWRVVLPWALPNIITSILLGCVEVAGSATVLLFVGGLGDYGVGLFRQVTSLDYLVLAVHLTESKPLRDSMGTYQLTAAVLLLIVTMGLGIVAFGLKRWLYKRFRGGLAAA